MTTRTEDQKGAERTCHVIFDTNILYSPDKRYLTNTGFNNFVDKYAHLHNLQIIIPWIVLEEISYQVMHAINEHRDKISKGMRFITEATESRCSKKIESSRLRRQIDRKSSKWIDRHGIKIIGVPFASIDWKRVVQSAVRREPPFSETEGERMSEKGFRDYLIYESVESYIVNERIGSSNVFFVSNDKLLADYMRRELGNSSKLSVMNTLTEFTAFLDATAEKNDEARLASLVKKASAKFFGDGHSSSLMDLWDIGRKVQEKYGDYFGNPLLSGDLVERNIAKLIFGEAQRWRNEEPGVFVTGETVYHRKENDSVIVWKTKLFYSAVYKKDARNLLFAPIENESDPRELLLEFHVFWRSSVSRDNRFLDREFDRVEMAANRFGPLR